LESKKFEKIAKNHKFHPLPGWSSFHTPFHLIFLFQTPLSSHNVGLVPRFEHLHGSLAVRWVTYNPSERRTHDRAVKMVEKELGLLDDEEEEPEAEREEEEDEDGIEESD
jgi:hypothetical protein